jgi:hypothetical protein
MDRQVWTGVMAAVRRAARAIKRLGLAGRKCLYPDRLTVAMYLWCVWHDRPLCWACDRSHYNTLFRPRKLPSVSQFTRRVKTDSVQRILRRVHDELSSAGLASPLSYLDGKPLVVGGASKDRDAARGYAIGGFAKGYKLHAWASEDGRIPLWAVTPLNTAEQSVAAELLCPNLPRWAMPPHAVIAADSNYDSAPLHKAVAPLDLCLLTPLRSQGRVKNGRHHPVTLRQMGPGRRELVRIWAEHPHLARYLLKDRTTIERVFSALTSWGGGLGPLPAWVRTLGRVRRWVGGKIILYHARLRVRKRLAA